MGVRSSSLPGENFSFLGLLLVVWELKKYKILCHAQNLVQKPL